MVLIWSIFFILFLWRYKKQPVSLITSTLFIIQACLLIIISIFPILSIQSILLAIPLMIIILAGLFILFISPLILISGLIVSGQLLIRREGLSFRNLLSIGLGIVTFIYLIICPLTLDVMGSTWYAYSYQYISLIILYFIIVCSLYLTTALLNMFHPFVDHLDYIIVLGAGLNGKKVTPLLASRIDQGIRLLYKFPNAKLILSGGQGSNELIPESHAMRNYAIEQGLSPDRIIIEDKSTTSRENLLFSRELMTIPQPNVAIVTNNYHILRALYIAKDIHFPCIGYGANTKLYFSINATIRELIAYLVLTRKWHITAVTIISLAFAVFHLVILK